jgi:glycerophosphoryl diester phosphodiesterase
MKMSNIAHRLGKRELVGEENTIARFKANLKYQHLEAYQYIEFDINETLDHHLIVFHDRDFKKFGDKRLVAEVSLSEIRSRYPQIPTLVELFEVFKASYVSKPIIIEIKRIKSDIARLNLVKMILSLRNLVNVEVNCMAFRSHWKKSFPKATRESYRKEFNTFGIKVYNVKNKKQDLFGKSSVFDKILNSI